MSVDTATGDLVLRAPSSRVRIYDQSNEWRPTLIQRDQMPLTALEGMLWGALLEPYWGLQMAANNPKAMQFALARLPLAIYIDTTSPDTPASSDVVVMIDKIVVATRMKRDDVLAAAGISRRTFYSWNRMAETSRPRLSSLGRLWQLADTVDDLTELVDDVAKWLLRDESRRDLLRRGRFDELLIQATRQPGTRASGSEHGYAAGFDEPPMPIIRAPRPVVALDQEI